MVSLIDFFELGEDDLQKYIANCDWGTQSDKIIYELFVVAGSSKFLFAKKFNVPHSVLVIKALYTDSCRWHAFVVLPTAICAV